MINSSGIRIRAVLESTPTKRLLLKGAGTAQVVTEDCSPPQWINHSAAHSRGGPSPCPFPAREGGEIVKGLRPFTAHGSARPKRLLLKGAGTAQAVTEDCSPPQRINHSAAHSRGGPSPRPFPAREGDVVRRGCAPSPPTGAHTPKGSFLKGAGTAQAMTEDCSPPQRINHSAAHSRGVPSPSPFPAREGGTIVKGLRPFTAHGSARPKRLLFKRSCHGASRD